MKWFSIFKSPRHINGAGLSLIKKFEGLRLTPYQDADGVWRVGYGCPLGDIDAPITQARAELLLLDTIKTYEKAVSDLVKVSLTDNQFSALVSFSFNVGIGAFKNSALLHELNLRKYDAAAAQFIRWDYVKGSPSAGLLMRREAERALFLTPPPKLA